MYIPFSSANPLIEKFFSSKNKSRLIVFNKADLANPNQQQEVTKYFTERNLKVCFVVGNTQGKKGPSKLIAEALKTVPVGVKKKVLGMMVVGVPNVGKSTIINNIRLTMGKKKSARTGPLPGVTRGLSGFRVCDDPPVFLVDTPGVMLPGNLEDKDRGLKLALTSAIKDSIVGEKTLADFLLFTLNLHQSTKYVDVYNLGAPSDDIEVVLTGIAKKLKTNTHNAAMHFVAKYRKGGLGLFTLDQVPPPEPLQPLESQSQSAQSQETSVISPKRPESPIKNHTNPPENQKTDTKLFRNVKKKPLPNQKKYK